jgi:cyanophycin synthetase
VITNVAEDHLGLRDIETLEDLAKLKALVVERVFPTVSRCSTPRTDARVHRGRTKARVALLLPRPAERALPQAHVAAGGLGAVMDRHDTLCLYRSTLRIPLVHARQVPITFDGKARFNIANALAPRSRRSPQASSSTTSAAADDVPPDAVPGARPRRTSTSSATSSVMVDYCHNAHGMARSRRSSPR